MKNATAIAIVLIIMILIGAGAIFAYTYYSNNPDNSDNTQTIYMGDIGTNQNNVVNTNTNDVNPSPTNQNCPNCPNRPVYIGQPELVGTPCYISVDQDKGNGDNSNVEQTKRSCVLRNKVWTCQREYIQVRSTGNMMDVDQSKGPGACYNY